MPVNNSQSSTDFPVAIAGAPRPYRQAIYGALDSSRFAPDEPESLYEWARAPAERALIWMTSGPSGWSNLEEFLRLPLLHVVAVTEDLSVEQFARALILGCDGVTHEDTSAEIVVSVLEAAIRNEVLLPAEAARLMAKAMFEDSPRPSPLTQGELQLLAELASGTTVVALANELGWSERTMRRRFQAICLKLDVVNRAQAIAKASRLGLLD